MTTETKDTAETTVETVADATADATVDTARTEEKAYKYALKLLTEVTPPAIIKRRLRKRYDLSDYTVKKIYESALADISSKDNIKDEIIYSTSTLLASVNKLLEAAINEGDMHLAKELLNLKQRTLASLQRIEKDQVPEDSDIPVETILTAIKNSLS